MKKELAVFMFDVDGVIAESPHEKSWRDAALEWGLISTDFDFTSFYQKYVAGIPGIQGAKQILSQTEYYKNQKIKNQEKKAKEFREIKQKFLDNYIEAGDFKIFRDIRSIIEDARLEGIPISAISSSENAEKILRKMDFMKVFDSTTFGSQKYRVKRKQDLYSFAFGKLCGELNLKTLPYPIVFEDADNAIVEVKNLEYFCIGIARKGLATPKSLIEKGANLAYDESALLKKGYLGIMDDLKGEIGEFF